MHHFTARIEWTGDNGTGTSAYMAYARSHVLSVDGKEALACSSAPVFRGDGSLYNPEDMLLYSAAACHKRGSGNAHSHCIFANSSSKPVVVR
jgi:organic hydroperoxide reductase OsmC/OhrA